jgi:polar amino acid transport system substrate-binding protein
MPAGSTMQEIQERGRLIVGVSAGTLQFGFLNPQSGQLEGFDIDVLKEMARAIFGVDDPPIEYRVMNFAERLPALENNDVDLVAHTMTINCDRWLRIAFSSTYYDAGQKVLVPKGSGITGVQDLVANGSRVCVTEGGTAFDEMSKPEYDGVQLVPETETADCLVAMQQGRADAAVSDDTLLVGLAAQDPNLEVVGEPLTEEPYGIGANQDNVDLVQFVNGVLQDMREDGRWAALYQEWIGDPDVAPPSPPDPVYGREQ